jgi:hypothetical protein
MLAEALGRERGLSATSINLLYKMYCNQHSDELQARTSGGGRCLPPAPAGLPLPLQGLPRAPEVLWPCAQGPGALAACLNPPAPPQQHRWRCRRPAQQPGQPRCVPRPAGRRRCCAGPELPGARSRRPRCGTCAAWRATPTSTRARCLWG